MVQQTNTTRAMKIYAITPAFSPAHLPKVDEFFNAGHEYLQLRDKSADAARTCRYVESVLKIAEKYPQAKVILNASNNYDLNKTTVLEYYNLTGIHQSTRGDKLSDNFCPNGKFNFLSCHNKTDLRFAVDSGFMVATLSPVFYTQSHPEQTDTLGIEKFSEICSESRIPIFALGGISQDMLPQFQGIHKCAGVAMIRGWFKD